MPPLCWPPPSLWFGVRVRVFTMAYKTLDNKPLAILWTYHYCSSPCSAGFSQSGSNPLIIICPRAFVLVSPALFQIQTWLTPSLFFYSHTFIRLNITCKEACLTILYKVLSVAKCVFQKGPYQYFHSRMIFQKLATAHPSTGGVCVPSPWVGLVTASTNRM